jgi:O-acetyl-ADP-ribose deacetylase (regulator of RNase III)
MQVTINNTVLELTEGDITEAETDAIVNAANEALVLGGGVAGAIRIKGGPAIQAECDTISPTSGEGDEDTKLTNATLNALILADRDGIKTLTFPAISTGIFGFPMDRCAQIMLGTTIDYLNGGSNLEKVAFCLDGKGAYKIFEEQLNAFVDEN